MAHKDDKGKWVCSNCVERQLQDRIVRVTPESERAQQILEERKREEGRKLKQKLLEDQLKTMHGKIDRGRR